MAPDKVGQNSAISLQEQIEQEEMLEKQGAYIYIRSARQSYGHQNSDIARIVQLAARLIPQDVQKL